jgi:CRISPR-associated protein Csx17
VFRRRQLEAFRNGLVGVPLYSPRPARLDDVLGLLHGDTDDDVLIDLLWGLIGVEYPPDFTQPQRSEAAIPFEFGVPRLLVESLPLTAVRDRWRFGDVGEPTTPDPEVFHSLASGKRDAVGACVDHAARRLKSGGRLVNGYRNRRQSGKPLAIVSLIPAKRLLASMLFPLSNNDLERIANAVLYPPEPLE